VLEAEYWGRLQAMPGDEAADATHADLGLAR